jgi:hypothetical protein
MVIVPKMISDRCVFMRAPLRFQELLREVETWAAAHDADCRTEFSNNDDEIPAFTIVHHGSERKLHFRLVKGWPPIIEVRREDFIDDEHNLKLLRVNPDNTWSPPLQNLLAPWLSGKPFDMPPPPLRFQELQRELEVWCGEHGCSVDLAFKPEEPSVPTLTLHMPDDGRELRFDLVKAWPPIIEVRRSDANGDGARLIKVDPDNSWNPPIYKLLDPWKAGRPFEA